MWRSYWFIFWTALQGIERTTTAPPPAKKKKTNLVSNSYSIPSCTRASMKSVTCQSTTAIRSLLLLEISTPPLLFRKQTQPLAQMSPSRPTPPYSLFSSFLQCQSCQVSTKVNLSRYFATPTGLLKSHDILKEHNITCHYMWAPELSEPHTENSKSTCKINWHKSPHVFIPIYIHMTLPSSTFQKQSCPIQALTKTKTSSTIISIIILIILIFHF